MRLFLWEIVRRLWKWNGVLKSVFGVSFMPQVMLGVGQTLDGDISRWWGGGGGSSGMRRSRWREHDVFPLIVCIDWIQTHFQRTIFISVQFDSIFQFFYIINASFSAFPCRQPIPLPPAWEISKRWDDYFIKLQSHKKTLNYHDYRQR